MAFATADTGFKQAVPELENAYLADPVMSSILERLLPANVLGEIEPDLIHISDWAIHEGHDLAVRMEMYQPKLRQYDQWCRRIDELETHESWKKSKEIAAREGVVAIAYERRYGQYSRIYQVAKLILWTPGGGMYGCPIAMTDGCARVLELLGTTAEMKEVYARLTSRDPAKFYTSGQWMTERPGGSDVGRTETQAVWHENEQCWRVSGFKWFSSATDADVTMLLARTQDPTVTAVAGGNGQAQNMKPGSRGLSLYLAHVRDQDGKLNGVRIHRLKDKVGTKALPTAELELDGMVAQQVGATYKGVRNISAILNITRIHCGLTCSSAMQRMMLSVKEYARKREVFGALLQDQPLHLATLANMEMQYRATMQLTFYCVAMLGRIEALDNSLQQIQDHDLPLLRLLTPILKMWSAKNAFAMSQETMEAFGGQGYMEENQIGRMMRDVLVNTIWEGTTNVLSLDVLRVMAETGGEALQQYSDEVRKICSAFRFHPELAASCKSLEECLVLIATRFTAYATPEGRATLEASARGLSMAMADVFAGALLCEHAFWSEAKAKKGGSEAEQVAAKTDRVVAQRWCEKLQIKVDHQIHTLGNETRYAEDKAMLFGLAELRRPGRHGQAEPKATQSNVGEAKL